MVGPYRVLEKIGAGGMGEVFLAEDPRLGRSVALKRLTGEGVGTDEQLRRLMQEGAAAAALNHPNIAGIYDVLEADGVAHIVMEYVPGETLASRLLRGPLPLDRILHIAIQLCDGLAAAHARRIVHRDLKPSNVIVTADGQVKILDFGLAERRAAAPVDVTITTGGIGNGIQPVAGTPTYMSPEQLLGKTTDQRSDIYSLGVTLFQLATGRVPFEGDSFMSVALSILTGPAPDTTRELGPALGTIVARAIARDPDARYPSVREMRRDLASLVSVAAETPTVGAGPGTPVPVGPVTRQERTVFAWVATVVLISVLGGFVWWIFGRAARPDAGGVPVVAVLPLDTSSSDPLDATLGLGVGDALVSDLAGTKGIVVVPSREGNGAKGRGSAVPGVARALGAAFVVDGGVQVVGDQVRINVRVMRSDGTAVRGITEQGARADLLRLQRSAAVSLIDVFALSLSPEERARVTAAPTTSVETLRTYSEARALLERPDREGNVTRAIELLQGTVAADPEFVLGHAALSEAFWHRYEATADAGDVDRALQAAQRALQIDPLQPEVRYALALIYSATGQRDRAAAHLRESIAMQPGRDSTHRLLGEILAEGGKLEAGIEEMTRAIALRPGYAENYSRLGVVYRRAGRYADALRAFEEAVRLQPDNAAAHNRLGAAHLLTGDERAALADFRQAVRLGGSSPAYGNIGLLEYRAGRYDEAAEAYERAVQQRPNDPLMWRNMGDAYLRLRREADARAAYERGLEVTGRMLAVDARAATTLCTRAVLLAKLGRADEARAAAAAGVSQAPADPDVLYDRAVVLALGRHPDAVPALEAAIAAGYPAGDVVRDDEWDGLKETGEFRRATAAR
jgi:serine/threonine-protein kinase